MRAAAKGTIKPCGFLIRVRAMTTNPYCFVIMPIDNPATEHLWQDIYLPIIGECGFDPDRIDETDDGSDLSPQILQKIVNAHLIIADITMERQNCYFELGYAYGKAESDASVIVCCREDHYHRSLNYLNDGPQVHFDLSGRNIVWWSDDDLDEFRTQLREKIELRMAVIQARQERPGEERVEETLALDKSARLNRDAIAEFKNRIRRAQEERERHE